MIKMKICGFQKTTLLDYPGHVAATIFLGLCNFRCPFCHNSELLTDSAQEQFSMDEVLSVLKKRASLLEGVCITGGEPTLSPDLDVLIREIRKLGLRVKLDTNGYRPDVIRTLCADGLLDYIAMDIKSSPENYGMVAGAPGIRTEIISESIALLLSCGIPCEFRTTAVKGLHTEEDFSLIGRWIQGADRYFIQNYKESDLVLSPGFSGFRKEELEGFADLVRPYVKEVSLRGVDY